MEEIKRNSSIFRRISIRKYEERTVEWEKTEYMLKAAMQAPSAANQQPWEFYVVTNKEKLQALGTVSPYATTVAKAPIAIIPVVRKDCLIPEIAEIDLSIATENMWLAAEEVGLGGVWLALSPFKDREEKTAEILGLPSTVYPFAIFAYGYPAEGHSQVDRFDPSRIHEVK